eukprot:scaffold64635_cov66-Phaeocystis_antarctica.AAC.7
MARWRARWRARRPARRPRRAGRLGRAEVGGEGGAAPVSRKWRPCSPARQRELWRASSAAAELVRWAPRPNVLRASVSASVPQWNEPPRVP